MPGPDTSLSAHARLTPFGYVAAKSTVAKLVQCNPSSSREFVSKIQNFVEREQVELLARLKATRCQRDKYFEAVRTVVINGPRF